MHDMFRSSLFLINTMIYDDDDEMGWVIWSYLVKYNVNSIMCVCLNVGRGI